MFRRVVAPALLAAATVVALAGCGSTDAAAPAAQASGKAAVSAAPAAKTVAPTKAPAPGKSVPLVTKIKVDTTFNESFTVDEKFGPGTAKSAFAFAMKFHQAEAYKPSRMAADIATMSAKDFDSVLAYMSPVAAKDWKAASAALVKTKKAQGPLAGLVNYGYENEGWALRKDIPAVDPVSINNSTVTLSKNGRLVTVRSYLNVRVHWVGPKGERAMRDQERTTTLYLLKSSRGGWVIDGWNGVNKSDELAEDPS